MFVFLLAWILASTDLCVAEIESPLRAIGWSTTSLESTFSQANKENKLVFLYWGAKWCPPCNQIKKTIFLDKNFQSEIQHYLPFYMDGDDPMAQSYGEKFKVRGYPSMLVLNGEAREIYRLPTGLQADKYVGLLKNLRLSRPSMSQIVKNIKDKKSLDPGSWEIVANFSFSDQDAIDNLLAVDSELSGLIEGENLAHFFEQTGQLAQAQGQAEIALRFFLLQLLNKAESHAESLAKKSEQDKPLELNVPPALLDNLKKILTQKALVISNLEILTYNAKQMLELPALQVEQETWRKLFLQAMKKVFDDQKLSLDERLSSFAPAVEMKWLSASEKKDLAKKIKNLAKKVENPFDRQAAMSTATYLLEEMEDYQAARALALEQVNKSKSPFYFMSGLVSIEKKLNHPEEALKWSKKAYENSLGQATRIQWGTSYFIDLVKTHKALGQSKQQELLNFYKESLAIKDVFQGRNNTRLTKLKKALTENLKSDELKALLSMLKQSCPVTSASSSEQKSCADYFVE